jgi:tRNA 2-thiocytidine biosynthesis protein TtcA
VRHAAATEERRFPILPCNLCGSQSEAQRRQMKTLIANLEAKHPTVRASMLAALGNVVPTHLFDRRLTARLAAAAGSGNDPAPPDGAGPGREADRVVPAASLVRRTS